MISVDSYFAFGFVLSIYTYMYFFLELHFIEMITPSAPSDQRCETLGHRTTWIKVIIKYLCNVVYYFEMQNGTMIDFIWYKKRNLDPSTVTLRVFENYFKWGRTQVLEIQIQIENIVNFLQLFKKKDFDKFCSIPWTRYSWILHYSVRYAIVNNLNLNTVVQNSWIIQGIQ